MNSLAIQRIAWKEFRQQRLFFVAMVIITFLVSSLLLFVFQGVVGSEQWPMMITGIFAALFAAACGGTLYATEKEEGTFLNLQLMPLTGRTLMIGKVGTAGTTSVAFFVLCVLYMYLSGATTNVFLSGSGRSDAVLFGFIAHFGLMATEFFAWSLLFSLLLSRPLVASILGIVTASMVIQTVAMFVNGSLYEPYVLQTYMPTIVLRAVLMLMILAVDAYFATRWLQVRKTERRLRKPRVANIDPVSQARLGTSTGNTSASPKQLNIVGRFVWQALRTSWPYMLAYLLLVPVGVILGFTMFSAGLFCVVGAIAGSLAFTNDKTGNRAAFLANHGERPGAYWIGHMFTWFAWIVVVNLVCLGCLLIWSAFNGGLTRQTAFLSEYIDAGSEAKIVNMLGVPGAFGLASIWWTFSALFGCAIGQLCSLLIDKRLLATLAAVLVSVPAGIWLMLIFASDIPLWWTVLPMFSGMLFAGFQATKWWLGNRRSAWRTSGIVLAVMAAGCFISGAVMWKRANEIPVVPFDFAVSRSAASEKDAAVVNEIRVRLANTFSNYVETDDQQLFSSINDVMREMLDARHFGLEPPDFEKLFEKNDDLGWSWKAFAEMNRDATIEGQIAMVQNHVAENQPHLDRLHEALQFAIDNISHVQNMPPWQQIENPAAASLVTAPIPYTMGSNSELLQLSFYQAALDQDSHETWLALKRLLWMSTLRSQTYGLENRADYFVTMFNTWLSLGVPDEADLRDALAVTQSEWFLIIDPHRVGEAKYLTAKSGTIPNASLMNLPNVRMRKSTQDSIMQLVYDWIPSERTRTNRVIDLLFAYRGSRIALLRYGTGNPGERVETWNRNWTELLGKNREHVLGKWVDTTILPYSMFSDGEFSASVFSKYYSPWPYEFLRHNLDLGIRRQLEVLVLKLGAMVWQLDHGTMPTSPEELISLIGTRGPASDRYPILSDDHGYNDYFFARLEHSEDIEIVLGNERHQEYFARLRSDSVRVPKIVKSGDK